MIPPPRTLQHSLVDKKRSRGAPPPAPRLVVAVAWSLAGRRCPGGRPPRRALRSGPLGWVAVLPWRWPLAQMPRPVRVGAAVSGWLAPAAVVWGEGCGGGSLPLGCPAGQASRSVLFPRTSPALYLSHGESARGDWLFPLAIDILKNENFLGSSHF